MTKFIIAIALVATACGKSADKDKEKLASACKLGADALKHSADGSTEDFKSLLSSTLVACSKACDASDDQSCKDLEAGLQTTCKAVPGFCVSICETATSASLKSTACAVAKHKL